MLIYTKVIQSRLSLLAMCLYYNCLCRFIHQLTEVINKTIGSNFYQLVNRYRIEAAKEMLANEYSRYSIEAMGAECGFGSRSSFYSFFKKSEGVTPLEYRTKVLSKKDV